jgi:hypothetical protein
MLRWLGFGIVIVATVLGACGRQITGLNAPGAGSIQSGHMLIRYRVAGPLDFTNVRYLIVFDTSGSGLEPYPAALLSGFANFSFVFIIGGNAQTSAPLLYQYYLAPGSASISGQPITLPLQDYIYVPNSGGNPSGGGEFTLEFARPVLYAQNLTSPVPAATATATATSSPAASLTPAPAFTLNPNVQPTTLAQHVWAINFITVDPATGVPLDSMGLGGPTDTTFTQGVVNTTLPFDRVYPKPVGTSTVSNPSAQLQGFEIINAP